MARFVMVVASSAQPGRDDDYNHWYDTDHIHEICALPGVISGKRFTAVPSPSELPGTYLAIYEIEAEETGPLLAEMTRRAMAGEMSMSDALDRDSSKLWFYEVR